MPHVEALQWAEGLILVYPTWWYSQPAILKGWIDRVWRPGIAFTLRDEGRRLRPALANIHLIGVITSFGSPWWFWTFLMGAPGRKIILFPPVVQVEVLQPVAEDLPQLDRSGCVEHLAGAGSFRRPSGISI